MGEVATTAGGPGKEVVQILEVGDFFENTNKSLQVPISCWQQREPATAPAWVLSRGIEMAKTENRNSKMDISRLISAGGRLWSCGATDGIRERAERERERERVWGWGWGVRGCDNV